MLVKVLWVEWVDAACNNTNLKFKQSHISNHGARLNLIFRIQTVKNLRDISGIIFLCL